MAGGQRKMTSSRGARAGRFGRIVRRTGLALFLTILLVVVGGGDYRPNSVEMAAAPYRYSILAWEVNHLPDQWLRRLGDWRLGREVLTRREQIARAQEFFALGEELRRWEQRRRLAGPAAQPLAAGELEQLADLEARRRELRITAETVVEEEVSRVLIGQGITAPWGGVFPPVDVVLGGPPSVLVVSPRDRIYNQESALLRPGLSDTVKADIEDNLLRSANLSALVENTGGLSVYPSVALDTVGLRYALEITAHEWLHQWLFFRPLGRNFRASPEMLTLNETTASIAGEELGRLAYANITGQTLPPPPFTAAAPEGETTAVKPATPAVFDFTAEMRQTRRRAEELLDAGRIEAAEEYMERRRRVFLANGYYIRKLNQAYFAFHGAYATGPGSVSPIGGQLRELRRRSPTLKDFLETMAQFSSYQQFVEYMERAG